MQSVTDNLVLTGMTGVGKTAVAKVIAAQTGRDFLDLDASIEADAGSTIAEIFAREGEAGFRRREREAVTKLAGVSGTVIATGGWTVADGESRSALESLGTTVCLRAAPEALAARLSGEPGTRPVLGSAPDRDRIGRLLAERQPVYDSIPLQVATTYRTIGATASEVRALVASAGDRPLRAIPVSTPRGGYGVLIGTGLVAAVGPLLRARDLAGRVAIVTDDNVNALYGAKAMHALESAGARTARVEIPAGEASKSLTVVADLYNAFLTAQLDRGSTVVALGGGVVGDVAGFGAATFLRGVALVQVPTSLLAMVDSAVGGKTGVNLPAGKNLVGAFKHPAVVIADPSVLRTLPPKELTAGLAEVVKAGIVGDPGLVENLEESGAPERDDADAWTEIVGRAVEVKARIVSEDPEESGRRVVLNLGHTFAHALEHATGHKLAHGPAVSIGLVAAARLARRLGHAPPDLPDRIESVLRGLGLPVRYAGPEPSSVTRSMQADKKRAGDRLTFVLPTDLGDVTVVDDVPEADVVAVLEDLRGPVDTSWRRA